MTLTDKNKIFFALIHYILVEQKNVDWILKTSLIDFTGISSLLEEKPYKTDSILDDVVDYITNIKPYHVQFSHYFEHYQTHQEDVNVHVDDWIEPKISMRFDALKSIPDLNLSIYDIVSSLEGSTGIEYNVENLIVYLTSDNKFYIRTRDDENNYSWELYDEPVYSDGFYYVEKTGKFYKGENELLQEFNGKDLIDTHRANRLYYMGLHDTDEIKKELNANFKGVEITGGTYDIGKFGYDIFNYDTTDYDSPTIIYDYYFLNKLKYDKTIPGSSKTFTGALSELGNYFNLNGGHFEEQTEFKGFIDTTKERFSIPSFIKNDENIKVFAYKLVDGVLSKYNNFEIIGGYADIFSTLKNKDKIYLITCNSSATDPLENQDIVINAYIVECSIYSESNSDTLRRKIVEIVDDKDVYYLQTPSSSEGDSDKIAIQKVSKKGSRVPLLNPTITGKELEISLLNIDEYEHINMVSFDFRYLYDKIYTWEDKYGRSNNIVYLNGNKFYRARYEEDRPSELVVSSPVTSLFVYNGKNKSIFFNDFKNKQLGSEILSSSYVTITNIDFITLTETTNNGSESYDIIDSIQFDSIEGFDDVPAKVLINSEIITYNNINKNTKTISDLKRASDGTFLYINGYISDEDKSLTHKIGDKAIPVRDDEWIEMKRGNVYKNYRVRSKNEKVYDCPSGIKKSSTVKVKKLSVINLTEDVTLKTQTIKIDSPYVINGDELNRLLNGEVVIGDFNLKINSDTVPFTTIYPDTLSNAYCIEGFVLPEEYIGYGSKVVYSKSNSLVSSSVTQFITDFTVQMVEGDYSYNIVVENDETYVETDSGEKIFRIIGSDIEEVKDEDNNIIGYNILKLGNIVNVYNTAINDVSHEFYQNEIYFGSIEKDNILYKDDGSIYGKIEGNKLVQVLTQITINDDLNVNDSIFINIHNFKYSTNINDNW